MKILNNRKLLDIQLELEGLKIVDENKIITIDTNHFDIEKENDPIPPKIMAVDFGNYTEIFYSNLLSEKLVTKLKEIETNIFITLPKKILNILQNSNELSNQSLNLGHYIAYTFDNKNNIDHTNTKVLKSNDESIKKFDHSFYNSYPEVYAVTDNDKIVSCCVSSRENNRAGESWVFTLPESRKNGFAQKAVNLWAYEMQKNDKIPFYTHKSENILSQKLAKKLKLRKIFETISFE